MILYVLRYWPTLTETFVHDEIAGLRAAGLDVEIAAVDPRGDPFPPPPPAPVHVRPHRWGWLRALPALFREALRGPARPRVLWLAPERPEPIAAIVRALGLVFPGHLPYGGAFPDTVPHLTVADLSRGQASDLDAIEREFLAEARRRLPLAARVETATLMYKSDGGGWHEAKRFTLGGQTAAA